MSLQTRYQLTRHFDGPDDGTTMAFVMLNPSTADEHVDDPTIRRCVGFAKREGFCGIRVANLFPFRSTDPKGLLDCGVSGLCSTEEEMSAWRGVTYGPRTCTTVVAWGSPRSGSLRTLIENKARLFTAWAHTFDIALHCLGTTKDGHPRHPLMLPRGAELRPWDATGIGCPAQESPDA